MKLRIIRSNLRRTSYFLIKSSGDLKWPFKEFLHGFLDFKDQSDPIYGWTKYLIQSWISILHFNWSFSKENHKSRLPLKKHHDKYLFKYCPGAGHCAKASCQEILNSIILSIIQKLYHNQGRHKHYPHQLPSVTSIKSECSSLYQTCAKLDLNYNVKLILSLSLNLWTC